MSNPIQVYQYNTLLLTANVSTDSDITLSLYTPHIKIMTGSTGYYSTTGSTISASGTTSFTIPASVNVIEPNVYQYEIYIENGDNVYTIISDYYTILPSIINN